MTLWDVEKLTVEKGKLAKALAQVNFDGGACAFWNMREIVQFVVDSEKRHEFS